MRIKTKTTTHNEVEQASNIFETYALQFYLKHLCRNATNDRHPSTTSTQNHPHFQELLAAKILAQISPGLPLVVAPAPFVRPPGWCFSRLEVRRLHGHATENQSEMCLGKIHITDCIGIIVLVCTHLIILNHTINKEQYVQALESSRHSLFTKFLNSSIPKGNLSTPTIHHWFPAKLVSGRVFGNRWGRHAFFRHRRLMEASLTSRPPSAHPLGLHCLQGTTWSLHLGPYRPVIPWLKFHFSQLHHWHFLIREYKLQDFFPSLMLISCQSLKVRTLHPPLTSSLKISCSIPPTHHSSNGMDQTVQQSPASHHEIRYVLGRVVPLRGYMWQQ